MSDRIPDGQFVRDGSWQRRHHSVPVREKPVRPPVPHRHEPIPRSVRWQLIALAFVTIVAIVIGATR